MTPPHLQGLNPPQLEAVTHVDGPLLILAGAGSGKTRVLTRRIAHLLTQGVRPWEILAVTFTNKAAAEMKHRVAELVGDRAGRIMVSTFHSACVRFLRTDIDALGYSRSFTIYDTDDQKRLLKQLCRDHNVDIKATPVARIRSRIDGAKNQLESPEDMARQSRGTIGDVVPRIYRAYEAQLRAANAVDFNDLVNLVVKLWSEHPAILRRYQQRFRYLMVDEYQDTNKAQYLLVKLLAGGHKDAPGHRNVVVVGDDDQSIYRFRGADVRNILDFERDFPDAKVVKLEQNYRSTGHILAAASGVVAHNGGRMEKTLWTDLGDGEPVKLITAADEESEARTVVEEMRRLVRQDDRRWGDLAVIYRTNASSRPYEQHLTRHRIPHVLVGARKFYERREVRDMLAYLKLIINPADDVAAQRVINVPTRGIGAKSLDAIRKLAEDRGEPLLKAAAVYGTLNGGKGRARKGCREFSALITRLQARALEVPPGALVAEVAEASGYAEQLRREDTDESRGRLANLDELVRAIEDVPPPLFDDVEVDAPPPLDHIERLRHFVDRASLSGQSDELPDDEGGAVTLLTAHLAKGLEFPVVFVVGLSEGTFPHFRSLERQEDVEEERRLIYVALTRAQRRLYLTRARRVMVRGPSQGGGAWGAGFRDVDPSRFLRELPKDAVQFGRGGAANVPGGFGQRLDARFAERRRAQAQRARLRTQEPAARPGQRSLFGGGGGLTNHDTPPRDAPAPSAADGALRTQVPESIEAFSVGARVLHPKFGAGVVRRREGSASNLKLHIQFERAGRKTVLVRYANLEIVVG